VRVPGLALLSLLAAVMVGLLGASRPAEAALFRGVEFPQGAASFADEVVAYAPVNGSSLRSDVKNPAEALGPPDDVTGIPAEYVSLGNGGSITLRFINNALTGSGTATKDLWVFEIGPAVEDTSVAISRDGITWIEVGNVAGSTSGIDIDPFITDPTTRYSFVRLTDIAAADFSTGDTAGADIDAVGAISTVVRPADTTAPVVMAPANITAEATGPGGALVTFTVTASDLVSGALIPTCDANSGDLFPLGTSAVTCSATDDAGNTGSDSFTITVVDTTAPVVTASANLSSVATSPAGAVVQFEAATASDLVDGVLTPTCDADLGDFFPLGNTTVTCTAADDAGNTGSDSFVVTVRYGVCSLFDQSKAVKAGAVKPIRVQLCDAAGTNLSEPGLVLHTVGLVHRDGTPSAQVEDAGQANPDFGFRYLANLPGYSFNLDTDGLSGGTWELQFTVNGGSIVYSVAFDVK
jgi:hypothetical protein